MLLFPYVYRIVREESSFTIAKLWKLFRPNIWYVFARFTSLIHEGRALRRYLFNHFRLGYNFVWFTSRDFYQTLLVWYFSFGFCFWLLRWIKRLLSAHNLCHRFWWSFAYLYVLQKVRKHYRSLTSLI